MIASGASVYSNLRPLSIRKLIENAVVQFNECVQQSAGGIESERQASFGEIDLHAGCAGQQAFTDVPFRFVNQVLKERLVRIFGHTVLRIEQTQGRGGDHCLFHRPVCVSLGGLKISCGVDAIAERTFRESR